MHVPEPLIALLFVDAPPHPRHHPPHSFSAPQHSNLLLGDLQPSALSHMSQRLS